MVVWLNDNKVGRAVDFSVDRESDEGTGIGEVGKFVVAQLALMVMIVDN